MKLGMIDYIRDPTPHDNFCGDSICSFLLYFFFPFFLCFFQRAPRSHFLTDRHDLYAKTRVFGKGCAFWGLDNIRLYIGGQTPPPRQKKIPKMGGNTHFSAKLAK